MLGAGQGAAPKGPFWGHLGTPRYGRRPQAWLFAGDMGCPENGWEVSSDPAGAPLVAQVPVQLCKKCRAWRSRGEIASVWNANISQGKEGRAREECGGQTSFPRAPIGHSQPRAQKDAPGTGAFSQHHGGGSSLGPKILGFGGLCGRRPAGAWWPVGGLRLARRH